MPIFEYECLKCGNLQEVIQKFGEVEKVRCDKCNFDCKKKFPTGTGFLLKGSGWPGRESKFKESMLRKNKKKKEVMLEREKSGESVESLNDLKK